jgi:hypothetical protein
MNKLIILFLLLSFTACSTISEKTGKIMPNSPGKECPAKDKRTIKDIFCKEAK